MAVVIEEVQLIQSCTHVQPFSISFKGILKSHYSIACHLVQKGCPEPGPKTLSLIGQPNSEAHGPTGTEVILGFPSVTHSWPGPTPFFSRGHCPDVQMVREPLTCMAFLGGLGGVRNAHSQSPLTTSKTGGPWLGPEPAEVVRERKDDPGHGTQQEVRTLGSIPYLAMDFGRNSFQTGFSTC